MPVSEKLPEFLAHLSESIQQETFIKLSLGHYKGSEADLKNIYIKKILVKKAEKLSFNFRYKTKDIVRNFDLTEAFQQLEKYIGSDFLVATLQTTAADIQFEILKNGKDVLRRNAPSASQTPTLQHDNIKNRLIAPQGKTYLTDLGITDPKGEVIRSSADKYRQINHYIDILSGLIRELPPRETLRIADMGSGKGYLTFALYDYLINVANRGASITGVEFRPDLVSLCNGIAANAAFKGLRFQEGSIEDYQTGPLDVLIALHACDTATDDAIFKGIQAGAELIVVAPCCHKQIRREMEKSKSGNDLRFLTRYGIFLERQAEMVTDGIRALILEYFGYKTKVLEFISDTHTPKNVMIVGVKSKDTGHRDDALRKIREAKDYFGISYHHLERISGI